MYLYIHIHVTNYRKKKCTANDFRLTHSDGTSFVIYITINTVIGFLKNCRINQMSSYVKVNSNYDFQSERELANQRNFKKEKIKESKLSAKTKLEILI